MRKKNMSKHWNFPGGSLEPRKTCIYVQNSTSKIYYYPNLVILIVDNNEHQRIDDVSTDHISYDIRSVETMCFAL